MKRKNSKKFSFFCYILILYLIASTHKCEIVNLNNIQTNLTPAVYSITSRSFGPYYNNLVYRRTSEQTIYFSKRNKGFMKNLRFIPSKNYQSTYYIEFVYKRKILGLNETDLNSIILYDNITEISLDRSIIRWKIYNIMNKNYIIQNMYTKKFWRTKKFIYLDCTGSLKYVNDSNFIRTDLIQNTMLFRIIKLYEEVRMKEEHVQIIEKEPIDVLIKYIDLSDPFLKRDGIKQIKKDKDNGELKYCLRSIFKFIPWVRKIFILMPNEKVSFLKPLEEIKEKIVYIKDKDLLGFDSESSTAFQYILFRLKDFGISDNFLLMDDDYFIGKPLKKTDFFYFDDNSQKIVPIITTMNSNFREVQKNELISTISYSLNMNCNDATLSHTPTGWKATKARSLLLLMEQVGRPLISGGFDHNTIPVNVNDIEEIYNLIYLKYKYSFITLYSKTRTKYDLQFQLLYTTYTLNKLNRKVKQIYSQYFDVKNARNVTYGIGLFCINTGFIEYNDIDFENLKNKLKELFPEPISYEKNDSNKT